MSDPDSDQPRVVTPLESGYIRAAITAALPALNWAIYATNLDVVLHIQKVTTNQVYQCVVAVMAIVSVVQVVLKRLKDGRDPRSTAARIVMSKPEPDLSRIEIQTFPAKDELAAHVEQGQATAHQDTAEEAMKEIDELAKKYGGK